MKPEPPENLWQQLDIALADVNATIAKRGNNDFTVNEFAVKYEITHEAARHKIETLLRTGKIECTGKIGNSRVYRIKK